MPIKTTDFESIANTYQRELLAHCYRMVGSVQDAEDLVQDTYLRAWQAREQYDESRASVRTWLYRIATNACLTALERTGRRALPSGLVARSEDPDQPFVRGTDISWLQPFPDSLIGGDPAEAVASRAAMRLALVAAMQLLPARQRAVLILREVLGFSAAETADILESTSASVNSALQRARGRLSESGVTLDQVAEPAEGDRKAIVDQYITAFEDGNVPGLRRLLTEQVLLEMPPMLNWYVGPDDYADFMDRVFRSRGTDWRVQLMAANGQAAFACYVRGEEGDYELHTFQVLELGSAGVVRNTVFQDPDVFSVFQLPSLLPASTPRWTVGAVALRE